VFILSQQTQDPVEKDEELYRGFVWTGNKLGSGTDAKVSCWLEDVNGRTCGPPFIFRQKEGEILQRVLYLKVE